MSESPPFSACACGALLLSFAGAALGQDGAASASPAPSTPSSAPAAPATPAANPDGNSDAEAEALALAMAQGGGSAPSGAVAGTEDLALSLYGFVDFEYLARLNDFAMASPYPSFAVGNVNLYVGAELGHGWRSLMEFRLLYSPNGSQPTAIGPTATSARQDTTVADPADIGRPLRWGGIEIERAWLEYTVHPLLTIQAGQWLTPYGIWNVDHGSPTIIGVRRPFVVGQALLPEQQTGIQAYGAYLAGSTEIGYHLGLSNGRGPIDSYLDLDANKAITARLSVSHESPLGNITLGGTLYDGRYTDRTQTTSFTPAGELGTSYVATLVYDELALAADLRWTWNDLVLQAEFIRSDIVYPRDDARPSAADLPGRPPGFQPDYRSSGWYVLGAYRLPWWSIMPFFGGESYHPHQELLSSSAALWGGLNVRPVPRVVLKAQYTRSWLIDPKVVFVGSNHSDVLELQAAWSF